MCPSPQPCHRAPSSLPAGDVVDLSDGDQVPADIRILTANDMQVDNSSLTGESEPQERYPELQRDSNGKLITVPLEAVNLCFFTTIVTAGSGRGMVIGTGDRWAGWFCGWAGGRQAAWAGAESIAANLCPSPRPPAPPPLLLPPTALPLLPSLALSCPLPLPAGL